MITTGRRNDRIAAGNWLEAAQILDDVVQSNGLSVDENIRTSRVSQKRFQIVLYRTRPAPE